MLSLFAQPTLDSFANLVANLAESVQFVCFTAFECRRILEWPVQGFRYSWIDSWAVVLCLLAHEDDILRRESGEDLFDILGEKSGRFYALLSENLKGERVDFGRPQTRTVGWAS